MKSIYGEQKGLLNLRRIKAFLSFFASAAIVYLFGFIASPDPFLQVLGTSVGSILCVCLLGALYLGSGASYEEKGLKIIDWLFIGMTLAMMGCFQWIGAEPLYWMFFVVFPLLGVRIVISWFIKRKPKGIRFR